VGAVRRNRVSVHRQPAGVGLVVIEPMVGLVDELAPWLRDRIDFGGGRIGGDGAGGKVDEGAAACGAAEECDRQSALEPWRAEGNDRRYGRSARRGSDGGDRRCRGHPSVRSSRGARAPKPNKRDRRPSHEGANVAGRAALLALTAWVGVRLGGR